MTALTGNEAVAKKPRQIYFVRFWGPQPSFTVG